MPEEIINDVVESGIVEEAAARGPIGWVVAAGIAAAVTIGTGVALLVRHLRKNKKSDDIEYAEAEASNDED